jgi:hypothetical protein
LNSIDFSAVNALRRGRTTIEKLRNRAHKLGRRERLRRHNAIWNTLGCPILSTFATHIDHAKFGIQPSGLTGDFPTVNLPAAQIYIGNERPIFAASSVKLFDGFPGRRGDIDFCWFF